MVRTDRSTVTSANLNPRHNYNNNLQTVQTPTHVGLMMRDARIVPLDDQRLLPIRRWLGQSRGRWESGTLVVETTAFRSYPTRLGHSRDMRLIERFARQSDNDFQDP